MNYQDQTLVTKKCTALLQYKGWIKLEKKVNCRSFKINQDQVEASLPKAKAEQRPR